MNEINSFEEHQKCISQLQKRANFIYKKEINNLKSKSQRKFKNAENH